MQVPHPTPETANHPSRLPRAAPSMFLTLEEALGLVKNLPTTQLSTREYFALMRVIGHVERYLYGR